MCCAEEAHRPHEFMLKGLYHITVIFSVKTFLWRNMSYVKYMNYSVIIYHLCLCIISKMLHDMELLY